MTKHGTAPWLLGALLLTVGGCASKQSPDIPSDSPALSLPKSSIANQSPVNDATEAMKSANESNANRLEQNAEEGSLAVGDKQRAKSQSSANAQTKHAASAKTPVPSLSKPLSRRPTQARLLHTPLDITELKQTGSLKNPSLIEVSGLISSRTQDGVLFAINDSGNGAELFALSESGVHLNRWRINAKNRDWEDLAQVTLQGNSYLVIGDIGDNLGINRHASLYFVLEPDVHQSSNTVLDPAQTIKLTYDDGAKNVEAFAIIDEQIYFVSKEAVTTAGTARGRVYQLPINSLSKSEEIHTARFITELPKLPETFETRLAASFASVDLNQATAMDFDELGQAAYVLTYRQIIKFQKKPLQSWEEAFKQRPKILTSHRLSQAEALAVSPNRAVFFTSEKLPSPLWALPIKPPL